jgi:hypothetical protein
VRKFQHSRIDNDEDSLSNNISYEFREKAFEATRQMLETSLSLSTPERKIYANSSSSAPAQSYKSENERFFGDNSSKKSKEDSLNKFFSN